MVCLSSARTREFFRIKRNGIELSTGKIFPYKKVLQKSCRIVFLKDYRHDSYRILQGLSNRKVAPKVLCDVLQDFLFLQYIYSAGFL